MESESEEEEMGSTDEQKQMNARLNLHLSKRKHSEFEDKQKERQEELDRNLAKAVQLALEEELEEEELELEELEEKHQQKRRKGCAICNIQDEELLFQCDGCQKEFHLECLGMDRMPKTEEWFCEGCSRKKRKVNSNPETEQRQGEEAISGMTAKVNSIVENK